MEESGWVPALVGISLSYDQNCMDMWPVADKLANKDGGHNKFLESICVWLDIDAPRYWWSQADTYRVGVTKQSESTMHTIMRRPVTQDDFDGEIPQVIIDCLNDAVKAGDFRLVKRILPEGFLQRRIVCTNYKALRHIVAQRWSHRLPEWQVFCNAVLEGVDRPEYIRYTKDKHMLRVDPLLCRKT